MSNQEGSVSITGLGMASSLGCNVFTACAASRAGIVRPQEIESFPVISPEDHSELKLIAHLLPDRMTFGFSGRARMLRIAQAGLTDLQQNVPESALANKRVGYFLSLPDPKRIYSGVDLLVDDDEKKKFEEEADEFVADEEFPAYLLNTASRLSNWDPKPKLKAVEFSGHTGFTNAVAIAKNELANDLVDVAVVGGIDSLADTTTLEWLAATNRLKTPEMAVGLQPGEASVFAMLQRENECDDCLATIDDITTAEESRPLLETEPPLGAGLTELLKSVADSAGWKDSESVWLITDQNGENYRAMEWGQAQVKLIKQIPNFNSSIMWYPAASFGDTGAASAGISTCTAVCAFMRGYAQGKTAAVVSSSDDSKRSCMLISMKKPRG